MRGCCVICCISRQWNNLLRRSACLVLIPTSHSWWDEAVSRFVAKVTVKVFRRSSRFQALLIRDLYHAKISEVLPTKKLTWCQKRPNNTNIPEALGVPACDETGVSSSDDELSMGVFQSCRLLRCARMIFCLRCADAEGVTGGCDAALLPPVLGAVGDNGDLPRLVFWVLLSRRCQ